MRVTVEFVGPVRRPPGVTDRAGVTLPEGATVDDALSHLGYAETERNLLRVLRSGETIHRFGEVSEGDRLTVFLLLGGG
jgi:sulfur carrier protein ThiS